MELIYPSYYKDFSCIASDCPDSCCHEWDVQVDAESAARWRSMAGDLGDGNYVAAFNHFVDECEYQINGERNGFPFDFGKNILIALAVGLVVAFIATGVMKGQLKSVRRKAEADNYVKSGSMHITQSSDIYLYRTVNRVKKQTSSSSGSSGGRSSSHSSSGKF